MIKQKYIIAIFIFTGLFLGFQVNMIPSNSAMMISSDQGEIEDQEKELNFTVYPNPSESDVVV